MSKRTAEAKAETEESKPRLLALDLIQLDAGTQTRDEDSSVVAEYAQHLSELPPVDVFKDEEGTFWLTDGFHRYAAFKLQQRAKIPARIHNGSKRDALLFAAGANGRHGMRRSAAAKRAAVTLLLHDSEWRKRSDRWIAEKCVVSHDFVGKIRLELYPPQAVSGGRASSSTDEPNVREGSDGVVRTLPSKRRQKRPSMGFEKLAPSGPERDADGNEVASEVESWNCAVCGEEVTGDHDCTDKFHPFSDEALDGMGVLPKPTESFGGTEQLPPDAEHPAVVSGRPLRRPSPAPGTPAKPLVPPEDLAFSYISEAGERYQLELIGTRLMFAHQGNWMGFELKQLDDDSFWRLVHGIQETRA